MKNTGQPLCYIQCGDPLTADSWVGAEEDSVCFDCAIKTDELEHKKNRGCLAVFVLLVLVMAGSVIFAPISMGIM